MKQLWLMLLLLPALAQSHEIETQYNRIHLSTDGQTELASDTIISTLYAEEEGSSPAPLADTVNKKIQWAVTLLKKHPKIKLQTAAYTTSPVYQQNRIKSWRARQSIELESQDMAGTSELLGELQSRLVLSNLRFALSPEAKNKADDALIAEALAAFNKRAQLVTDQLKRKAYKLVGVNISTSGQPIFRQQNFAMAALSKSATAPGVEAGEQTVQVTVSGGIELE